MIRFNLSHKIILASIIVLSMITLTWAEKPTLVIVKFEAIGIPPEEAMVFTEHHYDQDRRRIAKIAYVQKLFSNQSFAQ